MNQPSNQMRRRSQTRGVARGGTQRRGGGVTASVGLRLTLRGRLLAALVLSVLAMLAFSAGRASAGDAAATTGRPSPHAHVWVAPGDTLWRIAATVRPEDDPRDVIAEIHRLNDLPGGRLEAGRRLIVPGAGPS